MPSSLRLSALLFAATCVADETSLIQDVKQSLKTTKKDGKKMSALMENAKNMLINGATPEVVEFAEEILGEIQEEVIESIVHESKVQQHTLAWHFDRMHTLRRTDLLHWHSEINVHNGERNAAKGLVDHCRLEQACKCGPIELNDRINNGECDLACADPADPADPQSTWQTSKRCCEAKLYELWTTWVSEESELRRIHGLIDGHFCPPDQNGTLHSFRVSSVSWMNEYMTQKHVVDAAELAYDTHYPLCVREHGYLDAKAAICDSYQTASENKACQHTYAVHQTLADFNSQYVEIVTAWDDAVQNVRVDELMRHREYRQIKIVECLLGRIHELNGRPCDEESGEVDAEMSHCHAEGEAIQVCDFRPVPVLSTFYSAGDDWNPSDKWDAGIIKLPAGSWTTRDESVEIGVGFDGDLRTHVGWASPSSPQVATTGQHTIASGQDIAALTGHAVVIHSWDMSTAPYGGERIGCGILSADGHGGLLASNFVDYPGSVNPGGYNVQGTFTVTQAVTGEQNIAWDLTGVDVRCNDWESGPGGPHCGLHIHPGESCDSHELVDSYNGLHRDLWVTSSNSDDGVWQVTAATNFMGSSYQTTGGVFEQGSLCIIYPGIAPVPPPCPDIAPVFTCLPVPPPHPCDASWHSTNIYPWPAVPQSPFSEANPGCNAYQPCSACDLSDFGLDPVNHDPTHVVMVDGCLNQNHEVSRETVHLSEGRTASVRCCSYSGDACDTDHLPGGCQSGKTFGEAVEICELNGERLCTEAEIESRLCCGTGCGFDGHQVWVADQSSVYGD